MSQIHPKLSVIGAGPGDPELITLKAIRVLKAAAVVLYDALVDQRLLKYAPNAEKIYVGKRKGCYAYQQQQIHELIVARAKTAGHVVRLKGGDPFVFGRGTEEIAYAQQHGLETAMVPGVSSAIAVPAAAGIPVTQRNISESFWVITATTRSHNLSQDIFTAAQSNATIVILMGMSKLQEIVSIFASQNKSKYPVAVIQQGTTAAQKSAFGTIDTIESAVQEKALGAPAVIVIGEVVKTSKKWHRVLKMVATTQVATYENT